MNGPIQICSVTKLVPIFHQESVIKETETFIPDYYLPNLVISNEQMGSLIDLENCWQIFSSVSWQSQWKMNFKRSFAAKKINYLMWS